MARRMWEKKDYLRESGNLVNKLIIDILQPYKISVNLDLLKPENAVEQAGGETRFNGVSEVNIDVILGNASQKNEGLTLTLDSHIYKHLMIIGDLFNFEIEADEFLVTNKNYLLASCKIKGELEKSIGRTRHYKKQFAIYDSQRIYFYENELSEIAYDFFSVVDIEVLKAQESDSFKKFAIKIESTKGQGRQVYLSFDKKEVRNKWLNVLKMDIQISVENKKRYQKVKDIEAKTKEIEEKKEALRKELLDSKKEVKAIESNNVLNLKINVKIVKIRFVYISEDSNEIFTFMLARIESDI